MRAADDVADAPGDPDDIVRNLEPWRIELDALYEGRAVHEYAVQLQEVVHTYGLSRRYFDELLDALETDVRTPIIEDWAALRRYCEGVASTLAHLCLELLGIRGPAAERYARDVGVALQLANMLRDVAEDAERGHVYLPADELRAADASPEEILAGHAGPGVAEVCRRQAERARGLIAAARADLDRTTARRLLVPEIWADIYLALLDELERANFDIFGHPPYLRRRKKLAIAARRWARTAFGGAPSRLADRVRAWSCEQGKARRGRG